MPLSDGDGRVLFGLRLAKKHECQTQVAEAQSCEAELAKRADVKVCGDLDLADVHDLTSIAAYFCGN